MQEIHASRIFVGKSRRPLSLGSTRVGSSLAHKYVTKVELPGSGRVEHSTVNYRRKLFYRYRPQHNNLLKRTDLKVSSCIFYCKPLSLA